MKSFIPRSRLISAVLATCWHSIGLVLGVTVLIASAGRAAQIDVTFVPFNYNGVGYSYSDARNWAPAVVPNNGNGGNTYRITIGSPGLSLDIDPTVDSLTIKGSGRLSVADHTFSSAFTRNDTPGLVLSNGNGIGFSASGAISVGSSQKESRANLGMLANYDPVTGTLESGIYSVSTFDGGPPATLAFNGARIVTNSAALFLHGPSTITDEFGNDALQPLAVNNGVLHLDSRSIKTLGDFTNNGELDIMGDPGTTALIVTGNLTNFDATTKTLTGGKYVVWDSSFHGYTTILQFPGADIVTNAADIYVAAMRDFPNPTGRPSIIDENGNDALRNFANNTESGRITFVDPPFATTSERVTNAGYMAFNTYTLPVRGVFHQTGGQLNTGILDTQGGSINLDGGWLRAGGTLKGTTFSNAVISPGDSFYRLVMTFAGNLTLGANSVLRFGVAGTFRGSYVSRTGMLFIGYDAIDCSGNVALAGRLQIILGKSTQTGSRFTPAVSDNFLLLKAQVPATGSFSNVASGQRLNTADGGGSFVVSYGAQAADPTAVVLSDFQPNTGPTTLLNISTRGQVASGERAMIGGFIVTGSDAKQVILRGIGPSLQNSGITGVLDDPVLTLHDQSGATITWNDNWQQSEQRFAIEASGIAPTDSREAAIVATLAPGNYTAVLEGKNGASRTALVEVYDIDAGAQSQLANISTRGFVQSGDNVMIGGFIVGPNTGRTSRVVLRGMGPSLPNVSNRLQDPMVGLYDNNGSLLGSNDDWKTNEAEITATGLAPKDDRESALVADLAAGNYTAILSGKNGMSGVGLVELYKLQ